MKIKLSPDEYNYLKDGEILPAEYRKIILNGISNERAFWTIDIDDESADKIRNFCSDKLMTVGFDKDYNPTPTGIILESLIDKFFVK